MSTPLAIIDSHCHLDFDQFDEQRDALLNQCVQRGMQAIVIPGVTRDGWDKVLDLCQKYEQLFPSFGLHPCYTDQHDQKHVDELEGYLDKGAVAVGEIGLDTFHEQQSLPVQQNYFQRQLAVANNHQLPVIVHSRKTQDLVLKAVKDLQFNHGGIMHAFSGSLQQAQQFVDLGFKIGFGGAATYDRANKLRRILKALPETAIVLETDSPDIPPSFARNQPNSPLNLFSIADILAEIRGCSAQQLAQLTSLNVINALHLKLA